MDNKLYQREKHPWEAIKSKQPEAAIITTYYIYIYIRLRYKYNPDIPDSSLNYMLYPKHLSTYTATRFVW